MPTFVFEPPAAALPPRDARFPGDAAAVAYESDFVNDRNIVPRVPLFGMSFRHRGAEVFFDHEQQREERSPVVESLANALRLAALSLDPEPVKEAASLLASGALKDLRKCYPRN